MRIPRRYLPIFIFHYAGFALLGCAASTLPTTSSLQVSGIEAAQANAEGIADPRLDRRITIQSLPGKPGMEALDVLRVIGETIFGGQLIISPDFNGTFEAALDDRPVREALQAICQQARCAWEVTQSGALRIVSVK